MKSDLMWKPHTLGLTLPALCQGHPGTAADARATSPAQPVLHRVPSEALVAGTTVTVLLHCHYARKYLLKSLLREGFAGFVDA